MPERTAYVDALQMLGRRELSEKQLRDRLLHREHSPENVDRAIQLLRENRALDDERVAAAYVRRAIKIKGRGRLRIQRELREMGIAGDVAAKALSDAFGDTDERALITRALQKKLRGRPKIADAGEYARVYQFLMRQGFSPAAVTAALKAHRRGTDTDY
jgi:regulatory protein